jgi:SDR family mycofactocin-dependent oxidoreductase
MGRLENKVAFVTGAARGQGRAHCVKMAKEGADIIAVDICEQIDSVPYGLGTWEDLQETARLVEKEDRRIVISKADVRDRDSLDVAVKAGIAELGRLDIVVPNAGIWSSAPFVDLTDEMFQDMIDVQMMGPYNACKVTVPHLIEQGTGGAIVILCSTAANKGFLNQAHYNMAKTAVVGLMRSLAQELAPHFIRVNTVNPSSTNTTMIQNPAIWGAFAPGVENPTADDFGHLFTRMNLLPIPWMEAEDTANAVAFLASDEARYITGIELPVDAGFLAKLPG